MSADSRPVPFGFRPDVEDRPEPPEGGKQQVSNTSVITTATWQPYVRASVAAKASE